MNKNGVKDFRNWMEIKERIDREGWVSRIKEGDVWWASVGENVGDEICGKGKTYTRPVLIFKKLSKRSFWAIPLTSAEHYGNWYIEFDFNGKMETAVISQIRNMSVSRLRRKIGSVTSGDYNKIQEGFIKLVPQKIRPSKD